MNPSKTHYYQPVLAESELRALLCLLLDPAKRDAWAAGTLGAGSSSDESSLPLSSLLSAGRTWELAGAAVEGPREARPPVMADKTVEPSLPPSRRISLLRLPRVGNDEGIGGACDERGMKAGMDGKRREAVVAVSSSLAAASVSRASVAASSASAAASVFVAVAFELRRGRPRVVLCEPEASAEPLAMLPFEALDAVERRLRLDCAFGAACVIWVSGTSGGGLALYTCVCIRLPPDMNNGDSGTERRRWVSGDDWVACVGSASERTCPLALNSGRGMDEGGNGLV